MKSPTTHSALNWAHPLTREWFLSKFGSPTEPQIAGWPSILAKQTTLISAPTGSGKTLSAFLICIDKLIRKAIDNTLEDQTEVVYVSPLKALGNDIQKNLIQPLAEINELAKSRGILMKEIRISVRTGDTLPRERQAMLKNPPHILITTPESLYILLTAEKSRQNLTQVNTIILDEIHAVANNKRGAHLALTIERLHFLAKNPPIRIGLSATQKPLELVAKFLSGNHNVTPTIINIPNNKHIDLMVDVPGDELGAVASNELWDQIYDRIANYSNSHRAILVFVNTRRLAERVAHHLAQRLGEDNVCSHHGSLSRKIRLNAEMKLKQGQLKVLVATASLELGIDIGSIDLVCQIGSPRAIAVALQRIGRAGHWRDAISKGRFFATTRDELLECAALIKAIKHKELDRLIIPSQPMDILAQQIIASCATHEWHEDELFELIKKAHHYANLSREEFNELLTILSDGIAGSRGRYGAYIFRDQVNGFVRARRGTRLTAITSGGAIPENGLFTVVAEPDEAVVGTLDEDFAIESNRGDVILLGTTSWIIKRIESKTGKVFVENAHGAPPSVPFWLGEAPGRTIELSQQVADLRKIISDKLSNDILLENWRTHPTTLQVLEWLQNECGIDNVGGEQIIDYIIQGQSVLGSVPTQKTIIAERFFDESGGMQLIIHAPFGSRINKAWGMALRKCFCRSFNFELQAAATDDGINIALAEQHSFPLSDVFKFLHPNSIKEILVQAVLQSPLFTTRWRWVATRSLSLVRFRGGKKVPPNIIRMLSDDLLAAVFPDAAACQDNLGGKDIELPNHPFITETMKDIFEEALDLEGLISLLRDIQEGKIECLAVDTSTPSAFSHEILNANPYAFLDDAPLEERRARAVEMRRILPQTMLENVGQLNPLMIQDVQQQIWPDLRNSDELHDLLQTLIIVPVNFILLKEKLNFSEWQTFMNELINNKRAQIVSIEQNNYWVAAEKLKSFAIVYPSAIYNPLMFEIEKETSPRDEIILKLLQGWLQYLGPTHSLELSQQLNIDPFEIEQAFLKLESMGSILRGNFLQQDSNQTEWCDRRILARIHRLTVANLRKQVEPATASQFNRWLFKWQNIEPGTQLRGEKGLLETIQKLQGFEAPATSWEKDIFSKRIKDYDPRMLDHLCLSGTIGWGRFSKHSSFNLDIEDSEKKRISPTSAVPITFFIRDETSWISNKKLFSEEELTGLSHTAKSIYLYLKQRGASFFSDIERSAHKLPTEIEIGLWELVAAGLITADSFDSLRALINPKRRLDKRKRGLQLRHNSSRWALLYIHETEEDNQTIEALCWVLLNRYGVVFRDLLAREKNLPSWRELLIEFRKLEDKGIIRGGRFVSGFQGEQFALPYAVDSLRASKKETATNQITTISAVDPLNLVGIILPGARITATRNNQITFKDGIVQE